MFQPVSCGISLIAWEIYFSAGQICNVNCCYDVQREIDSPYYIIDHVTFVHGFFHNLFIYREHTLNAVGEITRNVHHYLKKWKMHTFHFERCVVW